MSDELDAKCTPLYLWNKPKYSTWVTCTYFLNPGAKTKGTRTPKWVTGCPDKAAAEKVAELLRKFPGNFSYIRIRDHEPQYEKARYKVSKTEYKETVKFLKAKIKEQLNG